MFAVAVRAFKGFEDLFDPPAYFLASDDLVSTGTHARLTIRPNDAQLFCSLIEARTGIEKMLSIRASHNDKKRTWPSGFHIRTGLEINYKRPSKKGFLAIYKASADADLVLGEPMEIYDVEGQLTETDPFKASKSNNVFSFAYTKRELHHEEKSLPRRAGCVPA